MCDKVNFINLSRYSHLSARTYQRHFAKPYAFMQMNAVLIDEAIAAKHFQVVVYLVNHKHPERLCYALLFSTDIDIDPIRLYEAYRARFQIEFIFRDALAKPCRRL